MITTRQPEPQPMNLIQSYEVHLRSRGFRPRGNVHISFDYTSEDVMKQAAVQRGPSTDEGTFGVMRTGDSQLTLLSLELPWVDVNNDGIGDPQKSCVTPGTYIMKWHLSPHHGWCYQITGVKDRTDVLCHPANFAGKVDEGYASDLLGCMAFGYAVGRLVPDPVKYPQATQGAQKALVRDKDSRGSRAAVEAFNAWGAEEDIELTIT